MGCLLPFNAFTASRVCPQVPKPYSMHRADVVGAVSALAGLLELKGMSVSSVNSMIL